MDKSAQVRSSARRVDACWQVRSDLGKHRLCGTHEPSADTRARSRRRCGRGAPGPGADVAGVRPVLAQMWQGCAPSSPPASPARQSRGRLHGTFSQFVATRSTRTRAQARLQRVRACVRVCLCNRPMCIMRSMLRRSLTETGPAHKDRARRQTLHTPMHRILRCIARSWRQWRPSCNRKRACTRTHTRTHAPGERKSASKNMG
jgi:hypothetical protein